MSPKPRADYLGMRAWHANKLHKSAVVQLCFQGISRTLARHSLAKIAPLEGLSCNRGKHSILKNREHRKVPLLYEGIFSKKLSVPDA